MLAFDRKVFATRLSIARKKRGLRQNALAETAKMSSQMISDYENDKKMPSLEYAYNLACALDVPLDWLCGREDVDAPELTAEPRNRHFGVGDVLSFLNAICVDFNPAIDELSLEKGEAVLTFGPLIANFMKDILPTLDNLKTGKIDRTIFDRNMEGFYRYYNQFSFEEARKHTVNEGDSNGKEA